MALISFNKTPYFDNFDSSKNHVKVLFKPGLNIQVRELNEIQSIFYAQLKKFASNIFKNGSRVTGGRCRVRLLSYAQLSLTQESFDQIKQGMLARVSTGAVFMVITTHKRGSAYNVFMTLMEASDGLTQIDVGSVVEIDADNSTVTAQVMSLGEASTFTVEEGTFYYDGYFISSQAQSIILNYGGNWSGWTGFNVVDEIVSSDDDPSLLDNAINSTSLNAPGADRYKIALQLTSRKANNKNDSRFIPLAEISGGVVMSMVSGSTYAQFGDMLATRTYEESGNYALNAYKIRVLEHKKLSPSDAMGVSVNGSPDNYAVEVSSNVSYVAGYRNEILTDQYVIAKKLESTKLQTGMQSQVNDAAHAFVKVQAGQTAISRQAIEQISSSVSASAVDLRDGPLVAGQASGNVIGNMWIKSMVLHQGSTQTGDAVYKMMIDRISMLPGKAIASVLSMSMGASTVGEPDGVMRVINESFVSLVTINTDVPVKTMKTVAGQNSGVSGVIQQAFYGTTNTSGEFTITLPVGQSFESDQAVVSVKTGQKYETVDCVVTVNSQQATVSTGIAHAVKNFVALVNVMHVDIPLKTKTVSSVEHTFTSIVANNVLPVADAFRITDARLIKKSNGAETDVLKFMTLTSGQTDTMYTNSSVSCNAAGFDLSQFDLRVTIEYFEHHGSVGAFTIDSYPEDEQDSILSFVASTGKQYDLRSVIDYRPTVIDGNIVLESSNINPLVPLKHDAVMYLPRIDTLYQNADGGLAIKTGTPSLYPVAPSIESRSMAICDLLIPARVREAATIVPAMRNTKRYTMRDIGRIENRIKNMEYYTSLSLLEKSAADMSIKDVNGLDRFKNGFLVDDFSKFQAGDVHSSEFRAALDRKYKELRPGFVARNRKARVAKLEGQNFKNNNGMITLDFEEKLAQENPLASKSVSINTYFFANKKGTLELTPNVDTWADTSWAPNISFTVDSGADAFKNVGTRVKILATEWGAWAETNVSVTSTVDNANIIAERVVNPALRPTRTIRDASVSVATTVVETKNWTRSGTTFSSGSKTDSHSWNNISDVTIDPYCRPIQVKFKASNMEPGTKFYMFFDGVNITQFVTDYSTGQTGSIVSTGSGEIMGDFRIPEGTFFTGQKEVSISTVPYAEQVAGDSDYSSCRATFFAGGIDVQRQAVDMQVITPTWLEATEVQSRVTTEIIQVLPTIPPTPAPTQAPRPPAIALAAAPEPIRIVRVTGDPIAQSFMLDTDSFVTSVDLYFATVDKAEPSFWFSIRRMEDGQPLDKDICYKTLNIKGIPTSADASAPYNVKLDYPVFVEGGKEYCFVVGGWSPDTRLWHSRLGDTLIDDPTRVVDTQPVTGSSFKSQNGTTWTEDQLEDFKYKLYIADFKTATAGNEISMTLEFDDEREKLPEDPFECEAGVDVIRVYYPDHGLVAGDKFEINMFEDTIYSITVDSGKPTPMPGTTLYAQSGRGTIVSAATNPDTGKVEIVLEKISGQIISGEKYNTETTLIYDSNGTLVNNALASTGVIEDANLTEIAGIPVKEIVGEHQVDSADTPDSFLFRITGTKRPTNSGRFGGRNVFIHGNFKYDVFNVSGNYMLYGSSEKWMYHGVGHNPDGGIFENTDYVEDVTGIEFTPSTDVHLNAPLKFANKLNLSKIKSGSTAQVKATFMAPSSNVSPVINVNTFSNTMISNRVGWIDQEAIDVAPNAANRFISENTFNGSEPYKYVTKMVTLKNPASDMMIAFDCYKGTDADFDVYYKIIPTNSQDHIDDVDWIQVPVEVKRDSATWNEKFEYELLLSNVFGASYAAKEFTSFKVKLVGKSKNSSKPPIFGNLRVIALT